MITERRFVVFGSSLLDTPYFPFLCGEVQGGFLIIRLPGLKNSAELVPRVAGSRDTLIRLTRKSPPRTEGP